jgi:hypothetical protein
MPMPQHANPVRRGSSMHRAPWRGESPSSWTCLPSELMDNRRISYETVNETIRRWWIWLRNWCRNFAQRLLRPGVARGGHVADLVETKRLALGSDMLLPLCPRGQHGIRHGLIR